MAEKGKHKLTGKQLRKLFAMGLLSIRGSGKDRKVAYDKAKAASMGKTSGGASSSGTAPSPAKPDFTRIRTLANRQSNIEMMMKRFPKGSPQHVRATMALEKTQRAIVRDQAKRYWARSAPGTTARAEDRAMQIADIASRSGFKMSARAGKDRAVTVSGEISRLRGTRSLSVQSPYNQAFIADAKALGGKWDSGNKTWTFSSPEARRKVAGLIRKHYGSNK